MGERGWNGMAAEEKEEEGGPSSFAVASSRAEQRLEVLVGLLCQHESARDSQCNTPPSLARMDVQLCPLSLPSLALGLLI